jgi:adenosylmethionine-8-amino-7-oxononanoate aminotransferase
MNQEISAFYPWSFSRHSPVAVRSDGVYIYDETGKRYLDASGGAVAVSIGHSVGTVVDDICRSLSELSYVHTSHFRTRAGDSLAAFLAERFPGPAQSPMVLFTSGGSEATETAIKLIRQYWLCRKQPGRWKIISRWHGYHGATLGALGVSGNRRRREPYIDLLPASRHISTCFCFHCPLALRFPSCELACAHELDRAIVEAGPDTVAGFILEPIVGATSGAVPPEGYVHTIREICDRHGIPLITDEIMTGSGRTGRYFAVEHWGVTPDIILMGKGLSSGYSPLGAVLVAEHIWRPIQEAAVSLRHSFTYQAHPSSMAAGLAVQKHLADNNLMKRAATKGRYLGERLMSLKQIPCVADVRGIGLLWTIEFLADAEKGIPFRPEWQFSERVFEALRDRGVMVYPGRGTIDGIYGDHILIAPPFIIENSQIDELVNKLEVSIDLIWTQHNN